MKEIKIFSLGGQDEDGKNLYVIELNKDIFLIDAGSKDAESGQLGVEKIVADVTYLKQNKKPLEAFIYIL